MKEAAANAGRPRPAVLMAANIDPIDVAAVESRVTFDSLSFAHRMHWRTHPKLKGRFLPEHPDDLQVIVHDGGPRITDRRPEPVWVTVTGCDGDIFAGRVLNQPSQLRTVQQGQQIRFIMPAGSEYPVLVTDKYLRERRAWTIHPCQKCGLTDLFDAPSDLMRVVFPNVPAGAVMEAFTSFCPLCRGVQLLECRETSDQNVGTPPQRKAGWQIWK